MILGHETITCVNPGTATGYNGMGGPSYGAPVLTVVTGCSVQEHRTDREIGTTDVVVARYRVFAPAWAPLVSNGYVIIGAADSWDPKSPTNYIVDGEPAVWHKPNGKADHIECYLRLQAG